MTAYHGHFSFRTTVPTARIRVQVKFFLDTFSFKKKYQLLSRAMTARVMASMSSRLREEARFASGFGAQAAPPQPAE